MRCALQRFKGLLNDMLSGLGQHLNGDILGNHIALNQCTDKIVLCIGGGREAHFNLLKSDLNQHLKERQLVLQAHGINQCLITVTQVYTTPDRCLLNTFLLHPIICHLGRHMICLAVFFLNYLTVHRLFLFFCLSS